MIKITIDGFNGTGKTTLAKSLAKELGFTYVSMGMIFRCIAYEMIEKGIDVNEIEKIFNLIQNINISLPDNSNPELILNGKQVTGIINEMKYAMFSSKISNNELLQNIVRDFIRKYADGKNVIVDGRDTGRLLFPDASVKLALIADINVRAKRKQNEDNNSHSFEKIISQMREIDEKLMLAKCLPPDSAICIDTTNLSKKEVFDKALELVYLAEPSLLVQTNEKVESQKKE